MVVVAVATMAVIEGINHEAKAVRHLAVASLVILATEAAVHELTQAAGIDAQASTHLLKKC